MSGRVDDPEPTGHREHLAVVQLLRHLDRGEGTVEVQTIGDPPDQEPRITWRRLTGSDTVRVLLVDVDATAGGRADERGPARVITVGQS